MFYRIQEYQRYKAEREAKLAEERNLKKLEKEKLKATIATHTLQARDIQVYSFFPVYITIIISSLIPPLLFEFIPYLYHYKLHYTLIIYTLYIIYK